MLGGVKPANDEDGNSVGDSNSKFAPMADPNLAFSVLFPPQDERKAIDDWLTRELLVANARVHLGPVNPTIDSGRMAAEFAGLDFAAARDTEEVLRWIIERMEEGVVHVNHPRYFGLFNPTPTFPAQCADRIAASFNAQLATATTSPFPVALEYHVIRAFARRAGMPDGASGHFTTGGSECNATALICALTNANPEFAQEGVAAFSGRPTMYVSRDAHLAWLKIAHQTGIGRGAVRLIDTDGTGRMDAGALAGRIAADRDAGCVPIMIAATAGTTGAGMVDPLSECNEIAESCGAWFHVDAAWGGALLASDRLRCILAGIERADSITIDAHKWLATTMGCGMFLTAHPAALSAAFNVFMDCMPSNAPALDPYVTTIQWSRRFLGLRLFMGLASAGWRGYAEHLDHAIRLSQLLSRELERHGWTQVNQSPMAVICMLPPKGATDARSIAQNIVAGGTAWVSAIEFEGQVVIRACLTSGESTEQDVMALVRALVQQVQENSESASL
jgi:glutamate/tyrosine decarboxylase-like PLP-dependent enzyme